MTKKIGRKRKKPKVSPARKKYLDTVREYPIAEDGSTSVRDSPGDAPETNRRRH